MAIAKEYQPEIAWRMLSSVRLLTKETGENPAVYRLRRKAPIDNHDLGSGFVDNECYFISFMGNPYTVISSDSDFIDVRDDFRVRVAPTSNKVGIIYKSVDGSPFIAPVYYRFLHYTAIDNLKKIEAAILWQYSKLLNSKWNHKGIIFSFDTETSTLSSTAGVLNINDWYSKRPEKRYDLDSVSVDETPVKKSFTAEPTDYAISTTDAYYIYVLIPIDELASNVIFRVNKEYWREKMFKGYITVMVGILNSEADNRELVLFWPVKGKDGRSPEFRTNGGWVEYRLIGDVDWIQVYEIPSGAETFAIHFIFDSAGAITLPSPYALKYTAMSYSMAGAPTLSKALNVNLAQDEIQTVTSTGSGRVTLEGIWL